MRKILFLLLLLPVFYIAHAHAANSTLVAQVNNGTGYSDWRDYNPPNDTSGSSDQTLQNPNRADQQNQGLQKQWPPEPYDQESQFYYNPW